MSLTSLSSLSDMETSTTRRNLPKFQAFDVFDDDEFNALFRVSKETVTYLNSEFGESITPLTRRNRAIESLDQILITLRFYATGSFQREIGDMFRVEQPTVHRIVLRVTRKIASLKCNYINMPTNEEFSDINRHFYEIAGFPNVIGAVDCTHIKINYPGGAEAEKYLNKKGYFSLKVQIVCDAKLNIRNVIAKWAGSVQNSTIFIESALCAQLEMGDFENMVLLGDNSYPCGPYLLTPILNSQTPAEVAYNKSHISTIYPIHKLFDVLKKRFPCLQHGMGLKVNNIPPVIVACAVLHNIALSRDDQLPDAETSPLSVEDEPLELPDPTIDQNFAYLSLLLNTLFPTYLLK